MNTEFVVRHCWAYIK